MLVRTIDFGDGKTEEESCSKISTNPKGHHAQLWHSQSRMHLGPSTLPAGTLSARAKSVFWTSLRSGA